MRLLIAHLFFALLLVSCEADPKESQNNTSANNSTNSNALTLKIADKTVAKEETFCLPVNASDFNKIVSIQYSVNWDPNILSFQGIKDFNLTALSIDNFGRNRTENGILTTSWFDPQVKGISIPNNTSIYSVCFKAVGDSGTKSQVLITSEPTVIEISNEKDVIGLNARRATIKIGE